MTRGKVNRALLFVILALACFGLLMVYSAGSYYAQDAGESALEPLKDQLVPLIIGVGALVMLAYIDHRFYKSPVIIYGLVFVSILLLGIVWIPGIGILANGSRRWLPIPGTSLTLQPGEIAKFALIMYCAYILDRKKDVDQRVTRKNLRKQPAIYMCAVCAVMFILVMKQPNLSTAGCLAIAMMAMLFIGGFDLRVLIVLLVFAAVGALILATNEGYRNDRMSFLDPWAAENNKEAYQLRQSLYAIGSGGLFGVGIGQSRQKLLFLPYCDSDFIFSIVCEELGLVGALGVIALFGAFIFIGFKTALKCKDRFGSLLAAGITVVVAVQVVLNIAVVAGWFPTTGLPLPFFSAGGTNLVIFMGASGVLLNITRYTQAPVKAIKAARTEAEAEPGTARRPRQSSA